MADNNRDLSPLKRRQFIQSALASMAGLSMTGLACGRNHDTPEARKRGKTIDAKLLQYQEADPITVPFKTVSGLAIDARDRIYVSGDRSVAVLNRDGVVETRMSADSTPRFLHIDADGNLYLGMSSYVDAYAPDHKAMRRIACPHERAIFTSIAVSGDFVNIADAGNQIVWRYDKSGRFVDKVGARNPAADLQGLVIPSPYFDVAVDPDGFLWAANTGRHCLENYTRDGGLRTAWGHASIDMDGFCGCCNPSYFTIMANGFFITSEKGIPRVKIYDRLGQLAAIVALPEQFDPGTVGLSVAYDSLERIHVLDPKRKLVRIFKKRNGTARSA